MTPEPGSIAPRVSDIRAWCVCVPARNEADRLATLLEALADQDIDGPVPVVIALNNTTDRSAAVAAEAARRHGPRLAITLDEHVFPPDLAHAGSARARAMALGADRVAFRPEAVLISTDADTRPPPDWVCANLAAVAAGADLAGGRLVLDEAEPLGAHAAAIRALWDIYWAEVRAIEDAIDPSPHDPAPRHGDHTGASLAITVAAWTSAGGVPALPSGEDRGLVTAARAAGHRLSHPLSIWTRVSPRQEGRASGGMAEDMKHLQAVAEGAFPLAPGFDHWRSRCRWRRDLRARQGEAAMLAAEAALPPLPRDRPLDRLIAPGVAA